MHALEHPRFGAGSVVLLLATACLPAGSQETPDVRRAEWTIEDARAELEEIVGPRLLALEPPPLPEVPPPGLSEAEEGLARRLLDTPVEEWSAGDRARLAEILAREAVALSATGTEGEPVAQAELPSLGLPLVRAARLLALRDRLALLEGRDTAFADGLEARLDLALRLALQPGLIGPMLGHDLYARIVEDVRSATVRRETAATNLERLDALLFRWRLEAPDAATVLAREAILSMEQAESLAKHRVTGLEDAAMPVFHAPWFEDLLDLARHCRRGECRGAVAAVTAERAGEDDPYRVIADLMIPNFLHLLNSLSGDEELGRTARTAVALRLEALEQGAYPPDLERLAPRLGLTPEQEAEIAYERLPGGGVRLRLVPEEVVTDQLERHQPRFRRLLTWELPPP